MRFHEAKLDNGLQVVAEANDESHALAVGFFVRTGARDETDEVAGVSHFLEHMVFKGTPTRSADDVNRQFDEMGAHYNAQTSEETTIYYAAVLPEYQHDVVELWADVLRPSLREDDFNMEKKVIIEEIRMYDDQPPFGADERCRALFFGKHPLSRSVLGTVESITDLQAAQMKSYFDSRYSPANITLVAAGRVDFPALVATAEQVCGDWAPRPAPRLAPPAAPQSAFTTVEKPQATQQYLLQMSAGPAADDDRRHASKLLATILGDDSGSRLFWELVHPGLAEFAGLSHYEYEGAGAFFTYMSCEPEQIQENIQRMQDIFRSAERDGITAHELEQARSKLASRVVLGSERTRSRMFNVGANWLYRREYRTVRQHLDDLAAVSVNDITQLLADFPLSRGTTIVVGPTSKVQPPK